MCECVYGVHAACVCVEMSDIESRGFKNYFTIHYELDSAGVLYSCV